jgi:hypothetical protein
LDNTVAIKASLFDVAGKVDTQAAISDRIKNDVGDVKAVANETKDIAKQTIEAVDKLNVLQHEYERARETIVDKTLKCDRQEQKTAKATQRANECEKNMNSAQKMARIDRDARRDTEAKLANAERITALYAELHDANAIIFEARIAGNQVSITDTERMYQAFVARLASCDATIKELKTRIDAQTTAAAAAIAANDADAVVTMATAIANATAAVTATKDAEAASAMATAMAAKDAEIARLTQELAAFRLGAMET